MSQTPARALLLALLTFATFATFAVAPAAVHAEDTRAQAAPFELTNLKGKTVRLKDFKGQVVVINFWATWCQPCLQELPHLDKFYTKYKDQGFTVLAISTDGPETVAGVRRVTKRQRWKMPVLLDQEGKVLAQLNPRGTNPFTVFVDRQGRIAHQHEGYNSGDETKHEKTIQGLLAEKSP